MTLRTKFIVVVVLFCAAVAFNIVAAVYYSEFKLGQAIELFESTFRPGIYVEYTLESARELNRALGRADAPAPVGSIDAGEISALLAVVRSGAARLKGYDHVLASLTDTAELHRLLSIQDRHTLEILDRASAGFGAIAGDAANAEYGTAYAELEQRLTDLRRDLNRAANVTQAAATQLYYVLFGMVLAEVVALMITFSFFRRWMLKPIAALRSATEQIARGNLDYRLHSLSNDELGALGQEVNHMAGALAIAQRELKQKERMAAMGEMVSVVAHNIRNPLAGIRATAQSSMHECEPGSAAALQQGRIISSVDSLEQWLKELLHLNRPLELKIEPARIDDVIADLEQVFQPSILRKRIEIDYRPGNRGQSIGIDRQYFVQALASLLDNAIEASPQNTVVSIRVGRTGQPGGGFFVEIADAGPGVPEAIRRQIFEPYFSTKPGGTGIGLSMAKKIVEAHAGTLSVGEGTAAGRRSGAVFRIEIPDRNWMEGVHG